MEPSKIELVEADEILVLEFPHTLPLGIGVLNIAFQGTLNDKMKGFYRRYNNKLYTNKHLSISNSSHSYFSIQLHRFHFFFCIQLSSVLPRIIESFQFSSLDFRTIKIVTKFKDNILHMCISIIGLNL